MKTGMKNGMFRHNGAGVFTFKILFEQAAGRRMNLRAFFSSRKRDK